MRAVFSIHQRFCQTASSAVGCARCVAGGVAGDRFGCAAGLSTSIQTIVTTPRRIASRARRLLARNAGLWGMLTDNSVVDGLRRRWPMLLGWPRLSTSTPAFAFPDSPSRPDLAGKLGTDHGSEIMVQDRRARI